jgi:hypothetical protein
MPSGKKVVAVRLDDQQYAALSKFAAVMGQSRGSLLVEMLDQMVPVWAQLSKAIEAARIAEKGARQGWREGVLCQLDEIGMQAESLRDEALHLIANSLGNFDAAVSAVGGSRMPAGGEPALPAAPGRHARRGRV